MSDDPKLLFYLKHRLQIEEWADLRSRAQTNLDDALLAAAAARARCTAPPGWERGQRVRRL